MTFPDSHSWFVVEQGSQEPREGQALSLEQGVGSACSQWIGAWTYSEGGNQIGQSLPQPGR